MEKHPVVTKQTTMQVLVLIMMITISVSGEDNKKPLAKSVLKEKGRVGLDKRHKITKRKADNHNHNSYGAPVSTSYGSPAPSHDSVSSSYYGSPASSSYGAAAPASETVDLHNKEFCVDVSTYQPVVWVERDGEECKTDFVKQCQDKSETVCADVIETRCEVSKY